MKWRELEGRELDRYIAERLGYYARESHGAWNVYNENGQKIDADWDRNEDDAWLWALSADKLSDDRVVIPHWSTSVDAALELFNSLPDNCTPRIVRIFSPAGYLWKAGIISSEWENDIDIYNKSAALSICYAWLTYKELIYA